jgi:CRP-like cAMP-binding protein
VWTTDFASDERVRDHVRTRIYYAFRRNGIHFPYPVQVQIRQDATSAAAHVATATAGAPEAPGARSLDGVEILASLTPEQRAHLTAAARALLYAEGETIAREGEAGASMFVVTSGEASVTLSQAGGEVARLKSGAVFGEMSLLTGDARSATVSAATDCELLEIGADAFRRVVLADAAIVEQVAAAVATRRAELERHRETRALDSAPDETPQTFLARVRRFLQV